MSEKPGAATHVAIPEGWMGPACKIFDDEMAKRLGVKDYDKASSLAAMLAHYDEMTFEPSKRELEILEERQQSIAEAKRWVHENVLLNPQIKRLMHETVRDLGVETGDPEIDNARKAYLAEMKATD